MHPGRQSGKSGLSLSSESCDRAWDEGGERGGQGMPCKDHSRPRQCD